MKYHLYILILMTFSCTLKKVEYLTKIEKEANCKDTISFKKIINNDWDDMLIITPYLNLKQLSDKYKINLSSVNNSIEYSDNINTIVFIKNKKVIDYIEIPRNKFQFRNTTRIIPNRKSTFLVKKEKINNIQITFFEHIN